MYIHQSTKLNSLPVFMPYHTYICGSHYFNIQALLKCPKILLHIMSLSLCSAPSVVRNLTAAANDTHIFASWVEPATPNGMVNYTYTITGTYVYLHMFILRMCQILVVYTYAFHTSFTLIIISVFETISRN